MIDVNYIVFLQTTSCDESSFHRNDFQSDSLFSQQCNQPRRCIAGDEWVTRFMFECMTTSDERHDVVLFDAWGCALVAVVFSHRERARKARGVRWLSLLPLFNSSAFFFGFSSKKDTRKQAILRTQGNMKGSERTRKRVKHLVCPRALYAPPPLHKFLIGTVVPHHFGPATGHSRRTCVSVRVVACRGACSAWLVRKPHLWTHRSRGGGRTSWRPAGLLGRAGGPFVGPEPAWCAHL